MKCRYCNKQTKEYQIDTRNNSNIYFPVCLYHYTRRGRVYYLPNHIPPIQGLKYLYKLQRNSWIDKIPI